MPKTAICAHRGFKFDEHFSRIKSNLKGRALDHPVLFSPAGRQFIPSNDNRSFFIYAPIDNSYKKVLIPRECPILYDIDFTYSWIRSLLLDMGEGSELYIELVKSKQSEKRGHITPRSLAKALNCKPKKLSLLGNWYLITYKSLMNAKPSTLKTAQRFFHGIFPEFKRILKEKKGLKFDTEAEYQLQSEGCFKYALHGCSQKVYFTSRALYHARQSLKKCALNITDIGGGYGFYSIEMAAMGHNVQMLDFNPGYLNVAKWLRNSANVQEKMKIVEANMADFDPNLQTNDIVTFFGSLLYLPREEVAPLLRKAYQSLRPGGVILFHENTKAVIPPTADDYDVCFDPEELKSYIEALNGRVRWFNIFLGQEIDWNKAKDGVITASVQKPF